MALLLTTYYSLLTTYDLRLTTYYLLVSGRGWPVDTSTRVADLGGPLSPLTRPPCHALHSIAPARPTHSSVPYPVLVGRLFSPQAFPSHGLRFSYFSRPNHTHLSLPRLSHPTLLHSTPFHPAHATPPQPHCTPLLPPHNPTQPLPITTLLTPEHTNTPPVHPSSNPNQPSPNPAPTQSSAPHLIPTTSPNQTQP